jgi:hypothetical protein
MATTSSSTGSVSVPAEQLSRVSAWDALAADTLQPVGQAASGPIGAVLGLSTTLYAAAGLTLCFVLGVLAFPAVRNFSNEHSGPHADTTG